VKHGIDFSDAVQIFFDPWAVEEFDDREEYGENRLSCDRIGPRPGGSRCLRRAQRDDQAHIRSCREQRREKNL
jgi:uncharacterized DUF497 family protein